MAHHPGAQITEILFTAMQLLPKKGASGKAFSFVLLYSHQSWPGESAEREVEENRGTCTASVSAEKFHFPYAAD